MAKHYNIQIDEKLLPDLVKLSQRFLFDRSFPDKAIDLLDESCALLKLRSKQDSLDLHYIEEALSKMTGVPSQNLSKDDKSKLKNLEQNLKLSIFGQDLAIEKIVRYIKNSRAGLQRENKPVGSFLFAGPTGVGKTELAKQVANQLNLKFSKFDMSEYLEKHSVSRLVGAPPGYVGYEEGGLLTEAISKSPYSLVLMDEIEKAHPDLINILLQIMDDASITDTNGKKVNCKNIVLIMTTNAGSVDMSKAGMGIIREEAKSFDMDMMKKTFSPEFLNRIDGIIPFQHLSKDRLLQVIDKFLIEFQTQLQEKNIQITFSKDLLSYLYDKGYDPAYGARPFYRIIQDEIKSPLVDEILFGKLVDGGDVKVNYKDNKIDFKFN